MEEAGEDEIQTAEVGPSSVEDEDLGMYWGTGRIATWCPTGECITKPQESGYYSGCEEQIELLKQKVRESYAGK